MVDPISSSRTARLPNPEETPRGNSSFKMKSTSDSKITSTPEEQKKAESDYAKTLKKFEEWYQAHAGLDLTIKDINDLFNFKKELIAEHEKGSADLQKKAVVLRNLVDRCWTEFKNPDHVNTRSENILDDISDTLTRADPDFKPKL